MCVRVIFLCNVCTYVCLFVSLIFVDWSILILYPPPPSAPPPSHTVLILPSVACTVNPYLMKIKTPAWDLLWRHIRPVLVSIYGVFQKKIVLCPRCTATNPSTIYRNASVQSLKFSERPIEAQFWQGWGGKILKFFGKKQNIVWSPYICFYFIWILDFYRSS